MAQEHLLTFVEGREFCVRVGKLGVGREWTCGGIVGCDLMGVGVGGWREKFVSSKVLGGEMCEPCLDD